MKLVYVIIVNWNNCIDTSECLRSLSDVTYSNLHIILINNYPRKDNPPLFEATKQLEVITHDTNLGYAKSNNIGIQIALSRQADYILILNNDTVVSSNFLEPLIEFLENHPKTIVSPSIYKYKTSHIDNLGISTTPYLGIVRLNKNKKVMPDYLSGACFLCKSEFFLDIGNFDESYFLYYEDIDWFFRAKVKGYCFHIVDTSLIWHKHSASSRVAHGWGPIKSYYMARNNFLFAKKHFSGMRRFIWNVLYVLFGSHLHLLFFCRSWKSLCCHYRGILDGLLIKA